MAAPERPPRSKPMTDDEKALGAAGVGLIALILYLLTRPPCK